MKNHLPTCLFFCSILSALVISISCSDKEETIDTIPAITERVSKMEKDGVIMTYCLLNSKGDTTVSFTEGEEIIFNLDVENTTNDIIWPPGGPNTFGYNTFRVYTAKGKNCGVSWTYVEDWTGTETVLRPLSSKSYQCPWYSDALTKATCPFIFKSSGVNLTRGNYYTEAFCSFGNGINLYGILQFTIQ